MNRHVFAAGAALVFALCTAWAGAVEVGQKAPEIELASTMGGKFRLSDFAGKKHVVVQFYVLDFTPT